MIEWPWQKRRRLLEAARAAEHKAFLDALQAVVGIVTPACHAIEKVSEVLLTELQFYRAEGQPAARAHNDTTEAILELERLKELQQHGFPVTSPLLEQYRFVLTDSDRA